MPKELNRPMSVCPKCLAPASDPESLAWHLEHFHQDEERESRDVAREMFEQREERVA